MPSAGPATASTVTGVQGSWGARYGDYHIKRAMPDPAPGVALLGMTRGSLSLLAGKGALVFLSELTDAYDALLVS